MLVKGGILGTLFVKVLEVVVVGGPEWKITLRLRVRRMFAYYSRLLMTISNLSYSYVCETIYRSVSQNTSVAFSQKQTSAKGERAVKGKPFAGGNFSVYTHIFFLESRMRSQPRKSVGNCEIEEWELPTCPEPGPRISHRLCSRNKVMMQEADCLRQLLDLCWDLAGAVPSIQVGTALGSKTPWERI